MNPTHELGLIGLGTMGRNLLLNLADHGVPVAGYDRDLEKSRDLDRAPTVGKIKACTTLEGLVACLRPPRALLMLVPAGKPVDQVIELGDGGVREERVVEFSGAEVFFEREFEAVFWVLERVAAGVAMEVDAGSDGESRGSVGQDHLH